MAVFYDEVLHDKVYAGVHIISHVHGGAKRGRKDNRDSLKHRGWKMDYEYLMSFGSVALTIADMGDRFFFQNYPIFSQRCLANKMAKGKSHCYCHCYCQLSK